MTMNNEQYDREMDKCRATSEIQSDQMHQAMKIIQKQAERIAELTSALSMALDACYDVDSHGIRHTNSSYVTALKCLEHKDNE